jgi:hypothetical protein
MAIHFDYGDKPRLTGTFEQADGTDIDPTKVFFKFTDPSGTTDTYEYGTDAELVKSATGIYYVDVDCDEVGVFRWRFYSTGTGQAAEEGWFVVEPSWFA